jgi:PhnB protein
MTKRVDPIPKSYHTITPDLIISGASGAIEFYKKAFGAVEKGRMSGLDGSILHAEIQIGDSIVMLADENPRFGRKSPTSLNGTPVGLHLYVRDVDAAFKRALQAGAKQVMAVENMFWGDRYGVITDPFGHWWSLGMHIEDVSTEEMEKRMKAMMPAQ